MSVVSISGELAAAPPTVTDTSFPSSIVTIPFVQLTGGSAGKPAAVQTGPQQRSIATALGDYVELSGVGDTVAKADTLYLRTSAQVKLRLTQSDGTNPDDLRELEVTGLCILEFPSGKWLSKLEASGSSQLEWFASGPQ